MSKKIHSTDKNFRPQLGGPSRKMCRAFLKKTNTDNLSNDWSETDAARYLMAKGYEVVTKQPIPHDVKKMLKPFP